MIAIKIPSLGIDGDLGEEQGYETLPVVRTESYCRVAKSYVPEMISAWLPNEEELRCLNLGKPIFLSVQGEVHPPVTLFVGNEDVPLS